MLAGASGQLRNMATVGGNLLQRTRCGYFADVTKPCNKRVPGSGCPAVEGEHHNHAILGASGHCVAVHPSDMGVALTAFDAAVSYESADGPGELPLAQFYLPVGDTPHLETALPPGALITGVTLPAAPVTARSRYRKVRERASYAFAIGSIAAALDVRDGVVRDARLAFGAVASRPWRARAAEEVLVGAPADATTFAAAADAELAAAKPLPRNGYKVTLMHNLGGVRVDRTRRRGGPMTTATTRTTTAQRAVGTAHTRVEGRDKVTGAARYAGDIPFAELAHGWLVLSSVARGRVRSLETAPVLGMPGVLAVLHHENAPRVDSDHIGLLGVPRSRPPSSSSTTGCRTWAGPWRWSSPRPPNRPGRRPRRLSCTTSRSRTTWRSPAATRTSTPWTAICPR